MKVGTIYIIKGIQLSGRAFDCRSRGLWFNSGYPLILNQYINLLHLSIFQQYSDQICMTISLLHIYGDIAQWQSIRLQIERSLVQLRMSPYFEPIYRFAKHRSIFQLYSNHIFMTKSILHMGIQLSGRAFDCRSRGLLFNSGCPLILYAVLSY